MNNVTKPSSCLRINLTIFYYSLNWRLCFHQRLVWLVISNFGNSTRISIMKKSFYFALTYVFIGVALLIYSRFTLYTNLGTYSDEQIARTVGALIAYVTTLSLGFFITVRSSLYKTNCILGVLAFVVSLTIAPILGFAALLPMIVILFVGNRMHNPATATN